MKLPSHYQASESGSSLVLAIMFSAVLAGIGAATYGVLQQKYRQVHQVSSWQNALVPAEAGIDLAMNELRKSLYDPDPSNQWKEEDGWSRSPGETFLDVDGDGAWNNGEVFTDSNANNVYDPPGPYTCTKVLDATQNVQFTVQVDAPIAGRSGDPWFRIRSTGSMDIPGGGYSTQDPVDNMLRKFDLRADHRTRVAISQPRATRLIEAMVKPVGTFRLALFGTDMVHFNNGNERVDSFDSTNPNKSIGGRPNPMDPSKWIGGKYPTGDATKIQDNADVATNGNVIEANNAYINGDVLTGGDEDGLVEGAENVSGAIYHDFEQQIFPVQRPKVTTIPGVIVPNTVNTLQASALVTPTYEYSNLALQQESIHIRGETGKKTYLNIIVNGDVKLTSDAQIIIDDNVYVRFYVAGDMDIGGKGFVNPNSALNLQFYGLDRPLAEDLTPITKGEIKIAGNGGFMGAIYAPHYDITFTGSGNSDEEICGAFVASNVSLKGHQQVHYDEALSDGGLISDYKVVSWFEDVR